MTDEKTEAKIDATNRFLVAIAPEKLRARFIEALKAVLAT